MAAWSDHERREQQQRDAEDRRQHERRAQTEAEAAARETVAAELAADAASHTTGAMLGFVTFDDDSVTFLEQVRDAAHVHEIDATDEEGAEVYEHPVPLHDPEDDDDAPLLASYASLAGVAVFSPDCPEIGELERRIVRVFGDSGWTLTTAQPQYEPTRVILVHLNIEVPASDTRTAEQIRDAVLATIEVGNDPGSDDGLSLALGYDARITVPLAEEV